MARSALWLVAPPLVAFFVLGAGGALGACAVGGGADSPYEGGLADVVFRSDAPVTADAGDALVDAFSPGDDGATDGASPADAGPDLDAAGDGAAPIDASLPSVPDAAPIDAGSDAPPVCAPACTTPPAPACNGNVVVTSALPGTCAAGNTCTYATTLTPCTYGCFQAACATQPFSFLGNTKAFTTGVGAIPLKGGTTPSSKSVSITTETYPHGTVKVLHGYYSLNDASFASKVDVPLTFDKLTGNNDQWYFVIPAQPAGTHVYWYLRADPYDASASKLDPASGAYDYTTN